jgi:hypothetical protein
MFLKKSKTSISWYEMLKRDLQSQYQAGMKFQKKIQVVGWKGDTLPTLSMIYDIFCSLFQFFKIVDLYLYNTISIRP